MENFNLTFFLGILVALLFSTVSALLSAYLTKLTKKVQLEIDNLNDENLHNYLTKVLDTVHNNLAIAVDRTESTLVKELKTATKDGKLTKEDQARVAESAKELFKQITDNETKNALTDIVGDTEEYLLALIDSIVLNKKSDKSTTTQPNAQLNS